MQIYLPQSATKHTKPNPFINSKENLVDNRTNKYVCMFMLSVHLKRIRLQKEFNFRNLYSLAVERR